jgi:hypothetical protein
MITEHQVGRWLIRPTKSVYSGDVFLMVYYKDTEYSSGKYIGTIENSDLSELKKIIDELVQ